MSKLMKSVFLKNKIGFHNIIEVQAYKKSNNLLPVSYLYELNFVYRAESLTAREYNINCSSMYRQYDKISYDTKKITVQYLESHNFVNDIKFLQEWDIIVQSNPKEMVAVETIHNNINSTELLC